MAPGPRKKALPKGEISARAVETLSRPFIDACRTYREADILSSKHEGRCAPISAAEFEAGVRSLSAGLPELGLRSGKSKTLVS
jgi:hypothetical protein